MQLGNGIGTIQTFIFMNIYYSDNITTTINDERYYESHMFLLEEEVSQLYFLG